LSPPGVDAGSQWLPPGGITERLDRVSSWRRLWLRVPLAPGRRARWLWSHGGYDVEGHEAAAQREHSTDRFAAAHSIMRVALDRPGPWPVPPGPGGEPVQPLDVDRWSDYALVIAYLDEADGRRLASMQAAVFAAAEAGWVPVGGSGGSVQLEGFTLESAEPAEPAVLEQHGRGGVRIELAGRPSRWVHHTWIRCSPAAAAIVVERGGDVRRVAFGDVALWIGVAWTDETEPIVRALGAASDELAAIRPAAWRVRPHR
jgi:hypothetical protein